MGKSIKMNLKPSFVIRGTLAVATLFGAAGATHAGDVSVAVGVNVPGVYGQINIGGGIPAPQLLLPQPMVAIPPPVVVGAPPPPPPLYLHVPPGYEKHWRKHCGRYNACGRPVYFVSDQWYNNVYVPHRARMVPAAGYRDYNRGHDWHGDHHRHDDHGSRDRGRGHGHDDHGHGDHDKH